MQRGVGGAPGGGGGPQHRLDVGPVGRGVTSPRRPAPSRGAASGSAPVPVSGGAPAPAAGQAAGAAMQEAGLHWAAPTQVVRATSAVPPRPPPAGPGRLRNSSGTRSEHTRKSRGTRARPARNQLGTRSELEAAVHPCPLLLMMPGAGVLPLPGLASKSSPHPRPKPAPARPSTPPGLCTSPGGTAPLHRGRVLNRTVAPPTQPAGGPPGRGARPRLGRAE